MHPTMSTNEDTFWAPLSDAPDVGKEDLSFESFDKDIEDMLRDWPYQGPYLQFQDTFSNFPGTVPVVTTPSSFTYSTVSDSEPAPSQYSFEFATSDCSTPSDTFAGSPAEQGIYSPHESVYADVISNDSSPLVSLPTSPPLGPFNSYGTSNPPFFENSPEALAIAFQQSVNILPPAHSVPVPPDTQAYATPDKPFRCPQCPFGKAGSINICN
jgi:hypothetical protein